MGYKLVIKKSLNHPTKYTTIKSVNRIRNRITFSTKNYRIKSTTRKYPKSVNPLKANHVCWIYHRLSTGVFHSGFSLCNTMPHNQSIKKQHTDHRASNSGEIFPSGRHAGSVVRNTTRVTFRPKYHAKYCIKSLNKQYRLHFIKILSNSILT